MTFVALTPSSDQATPLECQYIDAAKNDRHFADGIFNLIRLYKDCFILFPISLQFVPKYQINPSDLALIQIMGWQQAIIWTNNGLKY